MPPHGVTVAGNPSPIRIAQGFERSAVNAPEQRDTYRGERVGMLAAYPTLAAFATRASIRQDGASATAEYVYTAPEVIDVVEIDFNTSQRDWWMAPVYATLTNVNRIAVEGSLLALQRYAGEDDHTPTQVVAKYNAIVAALGVISPALATAFQEVYQNGLNYLALLPVVTFTRTVSRYFGTPFVIVDIGKVFSTGAMNANVPLNPQFVVTEVTNTIGANSGQTLGWLKHGRYGVSSDGSAQYIQQYIFDAYRTTGYQFVV